MWIDSDYPNLTDTGVQFTVCLYVSLIVSVPVQISKILLHPLSLSKLEEEKKQGGVKQEKQVRRGERERDRERDKNETWNTKLASFRENIFWTKPKTMRILIAWFFGV